MIPEFLENDRLRMFESQLKLPDSDRHIDYGRVFNEVVEKVKSAETEGLLSLLKLDEMVSGAFLQNVEYGVNRRIAEYLEFDEPVDECINGDRKIPERYWSYLERKLNERIDCVAPVAREEQVIKADEILEQGKAEAIENALFARIRNYEHRRKSTPNNIVRFFRIEKAWPWPIAAAVLLGVSMLAGYAYRNSATPMNSVVYQAQGNNLEALSKTIPSQGVVQSEKGGSLTIVNKKGYVELRNGSKLEIVKASDKEVLYSARFADVDKQLVGQGSATFFVNHQKKHEKYVVATHDYRVEVTGTYFKLQPDLDGHVSVAVREGEVKIVFTSGETKFLKAGQMLSYDLNSNAFSTINDGITVARQDIEQLPDIKDLDDYQRISINSKPSAGVRIDDRYVGMTPLIIMQPKGLHTVSLERNGYRTIDTAFSVDTTAPGIYSFALMENPAIADVDVPKSSIGKRKAIRKQEPVATTLALGENDFRIAENLESKNWQKAYALYRNVFKNPRTPKLRKETALFSMAKILAEHGTDKTRSKETFLHYLALFPTGNFVGESWLRLAELEFEHDQDKSIEYYQRYFEKYPRHSRISELQYRVGLIYLQKKKFDEAISMFKLSLANYQGSDPIEKEKINTSLFKAFKEKNESQTVLPASARNTMP